MKTSDDILLFLLKNFEKEPSINQIAELTKRAPSGVFRELENLEKKGMVLGKRVGNAKIHRLNFENPQTIKTCELLLISERNEMLSKNPMASVLAKDMKKLEEYSDMLVMFGSVLERKAPKDIDILVAAKPKYVAEIEKICREISIMHGKNIAPLILSLHDFAANLRKRDKVILDIARKGVVLKGYENFVEGVKNAENA